MTQKIKLDFIITTQSVGVTQEIARLNSAIKSMSASAKGPQAVNNALRQQMVLFQANVNAMKGHSAAFATLSSASQHFAKTLANGTVTSKQARSALGNLLAGTDKYGKLIDRVARQQLTFQSTGFKSALQDINGAINGVAYTTRDYSGTITDAVDRQRLLQQSQMLATKRLQSYSKQLVKTGKDMQWSGRQITMGFSLPIGLATAGLGLLAAEVDKQITRIVKVYDFGAQRTESAVMQVREQARSLASSLSQAYGFAVEETLEVMAEFAQQGRVGQELLQLTEETMRISFLGDVDTDDARRLIRMLEQAAEIANGISIGDKVDGAVQQTARSFQDLNEVLNKFNVLENQTVITVADLAEELPDLIGTLNSLNLSVEFGAAALTGMKEAGLNVNEAQTALRTGLQRLVSPTEKAARVFKQYTGKDLNELAEGTTSAEQVIISLSDSLRGLADFNERSDVLTSIFGNRQAGRLSLIFDQIGKVGSAFEEATDITGGFGGKEGKDKVDAYRIALEETEAAQQSLSGQLERAKAGFLDAAAAAGEAFVPILTNAIKFGTSLVRVFDKIPDNIILAGISFGVLGAGVGLVAQIGGTLLNLFGQIGNFMGGRFAANLRKAGVETELFSTIEQAMQHNLERNNELLEEQAVRLREVQTAASKASGYASSYASVNPALAGGAAQSKQAEREAKELLRQSKQQSAGVKKELKEHQSILKVAEKKIAAGEREIQQMRTKREMLAGKLKYMREELKIMQKRNDANSVLIKQEINDRQARVRRLKQQLQGVDSAKQEAKIKRAIAKEEAKILKGQASLQANSLAQLKIEDKIKKTVAERASLEAKTRKTGTVPKEVAALKLSVKELDLESKIASLKERAVTLEQQQASLGRTITAEKAAQLALDRKAVEQVMTELATEKALTDEKRKGAAVEAAADAKRKRRGIARIGGGGAGIGVAIAAQSIIPDNNPAGQAVGALASGALTGALISGPIGWIVGAGTALAGLVGPAKKLGEQWGLWGGEIKSLINSTSEFAEALRVPFEITPFSGTLLGENSYSEEQRFADSEEGIEFIDRYGEGRNAEELEQFIAEVALAMGLSGLSPAEVRKALQPALNAIDSNIDLTSVLFDGTEESAAKRGAEFARLFNEGLRNNTDRENGLYAILGLDKVGQDLGAGLARSFEQIAIAVQANEGELAAGVASEWLDAFFEGTETSISRNLSSLAESFQGEVNTLEGLSDSLYSQIFSGDLPPEVVQSYQSAIAEISEMLNNSEFAAFKPTELFQQVAGGAEVATSAIHGFAEALEIDGLDEYDFTSQAQFFIDFAGQLLPGAAVAKTFREEVERLMEERQRILDTDIPDAAAKSERAIVEEAFALALLADQAGNAGTALAGLDDEQLDVWDSLTQGYRAYNEAAGAEFFQNSIVLPLREQLDSIKDAFADRLDVLQDAQSDEADALRDRQADRLEIISTGFEAELELFDEQTEQMEEQADARFDAEREAAEEAAQAKIDALQAEGEAIEEQDRLREAAFEAEKARRDFFVSQRNTSVSLAIALATGDAEQATALQGQLTSAATDFANLDGARQLEEQRRIEDAAREEKIEAIENGLEAELELIDEARSAELKRIEDTRDAARDAIEERMDLEREAYEQAAEQEQELLALRQEAAREALQDQRDRNVQAYESRIENWEREFEYEARVRNPKSLEEWQSLISDMSERVLSEDQGENPGLVGSLQQGATEGSEILQRDLTNGVMSAAADIAADEEWKAYGAELADSIASGAFDGMPISSVNDLLGFINGSSSVLSSGFQGGVDSNGIPIGVRHSGGGIGSNLPNVPGLRADERPIIAQTGEFMLQRSAVQRLGVPFLQSLNDGQTEKYHSGGFIGAMAAASTLPMLALIRTMGEANGALLNAQGQSAFAQRFPNVGRGAVLGSGGTTDFPGLDAEQDSVISTILRVGSRLGANNKQLIAAIETAFVESGARNINFGDRDSLGVFQQRPSQAWGSPEQIMNVAYAAESFFSGRGTNRGIFGVNQSLTPGMMAAAVQRPAARYRGRYDEYDALARSLLAQANLQTTGFGPFGGIGADGLQPPDAFSASIPAYKREGVSPSVMRVVGGVLSQIPGAQIITSAFRPNSRVAGSGRLSNHARGLAVDIGALATPSTWINRGGRAAGHPNPRGTEQTEAVGDVIASRFRQLGPEYGVSEVIWKSTTGGNHFDHVHVGFGRGVPAFDMPSLRTGGSIMYDNTVANLHAGETVLTKPLTEKLERGIDAGTGGTVFNIYPSAGMDEERLATLVMHKTEQRNRKRGVRPRA